MSFFIFHIENEVEGVKILYDAKVIDGVTYDWNRLQLVLNTLPKITLYMDSICDSWDWSLNSYDS